MKILIISHAAGIPDIGPNMRTYYLGRHFVKQGHEVHIIGSGVFHKYKYSPLENNKYTVKQIEGITYHWLPTYSYKKRNYQQVINQIDFAWKLYKYRKRWYSINPDVVLVSSPPPFGIYQGITIAKKGSAKLIFEIRDLWPEIICELGNFSNNHPYIKMVSYAVKKAYSSADGIVSVKPGDLKFIKDKYQPKSKLAYIPNGYDHTYILDEELNHPVLKREGFKLIYTGALSSYYAIEFLLNAAEKLKATHPNVSIIIAGDGDDRPFYENIKKKKRLFNVEFLGFLPKKNMLSIIRQGDAAFLGLKNTKANRFGISTNKLYEYMYAKTPIIASYKTDYDLVNEVQCGLSIPPESMEDIYSAIVELYNMSKEERNQLGKNGYEYLMEKHTFERITDEYLKFIASL